MQLGFVSAILSDHSLEQVFEFAADVGFDCVEVMCWPPGKADRRYAGVTHIDVTDLSDSRIAKIKDLEKKTGVAISGLGYYPNPLDPDPEIRKTIVDHLAKVIEAAPKLGLSIVNTFVGRDPAKSVEDNWPLFEATWPALLKRAEAANVTVAIENCPMLFTKDEWPGGKNLAISPVVWRKMFAAISYPRFGLNFDPSHLVWECIDYVRCVQEFGKRIFHVHAKDARIDADRLYDKGILGLDWHTPKLPGLGDVNWGRLLAALNDVGYRGAVCIEVEDRAFEGSVEDRHRSLRQSKRYLEQFIS